MSADRLGEIEPMTDAERQRVISIRMSHPSVGGDLDECAICFLARMIDRAEERADAAEAALATADANLDESQRHNVEVSKLATDWMDAHDSLKAGQPYKLPSPVPVAQLIATAEAAGSARGVEAAAVVADEVSGRNDVPLLLRKSIWVAVRKDCASEIAAAIRALAVPS